MKSMQLWLMLLLVLLAAGCSGSRPEKLSAGKGAAAPIPSQAASPAGKVQAAPADTAPTISPGNTPSPSPEKDPVVDPTAPSTQAAEVTAAITQPPAPTAGNDANTTPNPDAWQQLPVIPQISETAQQIYQHGLESGNNPHAFSKVGDCGSTPSWFLGDFDRGPKYYSLGDYQYLTGVIQQYSGSYGRTSLAAKSGFNASSVFTTLWADRSQCEADETPLACEYRLNRPSIALITLGTNDVWHQDEFEPKMRAIIEFSIQKGVLPVLATKADNDEGDGSINATIVRLAQEYDIPLWNYWRAVQPLPDHGLQPDGAHITWGPNRFDDPHAMTRGWTIRNLTALQTLNAVWQAVSGKAAANPD